jgi:integral membrane protein
VTASPHRVYSVMATAEMVTWTALIAAMIARYGFGYDGGLFFVAGLSHGVIFLAYCITAVVIGVTLRWGSGTITLAVLSAIPPWLTIPFDRWLARRGKLAGDWRLDATDGSAFERFVRWWVRRPVLFLVVMVAGMALAITGLLLVGPPTQWGSGS